MRVELGQRAYDILIGAGLIEAAGALIREAVGAKGAAIVADANTAALYAAPFEASLAARAGRAFATGFSGAPGAPQLRALLDFGPEN